jgi:hypothetical protein
VGDGAIDGTFSYSSSNSGVITINNMTATIQNVGTSLISITFTPSNSSEYNQASSSLQVIVAPATQTISFTSTVGNKTVGDAPVTLTATVSGNGTNQYGNITFSSSDSAVVHISGSTATFVGAGSCTIYANAAATQYYTGGIDSQAVTVTGSGGVPCFTAGTMIRVPSGEVAVETLRRGDLVVTASGLVVPVKAALLTRVAKTTADTAPYLIPAGTYGFAAQPRDLVLSPTHGIQIRKGVWMPPFFAAKSTTEIKQIRIGEAVDYYHLECPIYLRDNLVANGCVVESFGAFQTTKNPYTYSARLGGFTRSSQVSHVARA